MLAHAVFVLLISVLPSDVMGYPNAVFPGPDATTRACVQLTPNHGYDPQTATSPFMLHVEQPYYVINEGLSCKYNTLIN